MSSFESTSPSSWGSLKMPYKMIKKNKNTTTNHLFIKQEQIIWKQDNNKKPKHYSHYWQDFLFQKD